MSGWVEFAGRIDRNSYAPEGKLIRVVICPHCEDTGTLRSDDGLVHFCACTRHWMPPWSPLPWDAA